jgi:drug/metabolite transporter (DMT)-like permease
MPEIIFISGALVTALVYAVATFLMRKSVLQGIGLQTQLFFVGIAITAASVPLFAVTGAPDPATIGPAVIAGAFFGLGQLFVTIAIVTGDASVQTSLMGTKVLWVALFSALLFGVSFPAKLLVSMALVVCAVFLIGFTKSARGHVSAVSMLAALGSAASYAITDSMLGSGRYGGIDSAFFAAVTCTSGLAIVAVALIVGCFPASRVRHERTPVLLRARRRAALAAVVLAVQFVAFVSILAASGQAARMNILYSSRGLWSVVLVWLFVDHAGGHRPPDVILYQRAAGAAVLIVALVLTV